MSKNMSNGYLKLMGPVEVYHELQEFNILGSSTGATLQIIGEGVEERHFRIEKGQDKIILKDLRSAQGTYVNRNKVSEIELQEGDLIHIGDQELMYVKNKEHVNSDFFIKSKNAKWNSVLESLSLASKTQFPILLMGPSGAGKDIVANAIHKSSSRGRFPMVSVNCSALTETLIESEFFGHTRGSFTGAISDRKGAFESARGGTLFLDEIGDLSYALQAKLLRAIENQEIRPIGSDRIIKTDVRIIAATHQNLKLKIMDKTFRGDLFFRLNVISIDVPPLSARMEDFESLLYQFAKENRVCFSYPAILKLKRHTWPGNIRELKNTVFRAAAFFPRERILEEHVDRLIETNDNEDSQMVTDFSLEAVGLKLPMIKEIERHLILKHLKANRGNQRKTASELGIPKSTLHDRLKYYDVDPQQFKA